jgi:hypothetical protein
LDNSVEDERVGDERHHWRPGFSVPRFVWPPFTSGASTPGRTVCLVRFLSLKLKGFPDSVSESPLRDVLPLTGATQFEMASDFAGGIRTKPIHYKQVKGVFINVLVRDWIQEMMNRS